MFIVIRKKIHTVILEEPYELTPGQKVAMRGIFADVMTGLSFYAQPTFIESLLVSPIIILMYADNDMVGFGTATRRNVVGYDVTHIMSAYVIKEYQRKGTMLCSFTDFMCREVINNEMCREKPLYITALTANPQVLKAMEKRAEVWPNLHDDSGGAVPDDVAKIITGSISQFYSGNDEVAYQVTITEELAGVRHDESNHSTGDNNYDSKFYSIADPKNRKLLMFCAKITKSSLNKVFVHPT